MRTVYKVSILFIFIALLAIPLVSCVEITPAQPDESTLPDESTIKGPADTEGDGQLQGSPGMPPVEEMFFTDFRKDRISYNDPLQYLAAGTQSKLSPRYIRRIKSQISVNPSAATMSEIRQNIGSIFYWKQDYFEAYAAGGEFVGIMTANQLMEREELSGCHDHGLILVSVFREFGFPALMVDAAGIQWARDYNEGRREDFIGHIFVEVWTGHRWLLIDSTSGKYAPEYNPVFPVIPFTSRAESEGYCALFKGLDPADYGISSNGLLQEYLRKFASKIETFDMYYPDYEIRQLPR